MVRRHEENDGNGAFFALFLLAEFQATEGLPAVLEAVSLPGDGPFDLFGDAIHDVLPRVLMALAKEECVQVSSALVKNPELNEYVRWSSANAIVQLAVAGLRPRKEIVETCKELLRELMEKGDVRAVTFIISSIIDLNPWEAAKEIEEAFQRDLVDTDIVDWESVEPHLHDQPMKIRSAFRKPPQIEDTIAELQTWASFRPDEPRPPAPRTPEARFSVPTPVRKQKAPSTPPLFVPPMPRPHVGRNDPCPCGSGKKFKKCCGGRR